MAFRSHPLAKALTAALGLQIAPGLAHAETPAAAPAEAVPAAPAEAPAPAPVEATPTAATPAPTEAPSAVAATALAPIVDNPEGTFDGAYGKGLTFKSSNGDLVFNLRTRAQLRGLLSAPDDEPVEIGFVPRRLRLAMRTAMPKHDVELYVQLGFAPGDLDPDFSNIVRDAMLTWRPSSAFHVRFGQGKVPFGRERVISSSALSFVDRTIVNAELNLDRDAGVWFGLDQLDGEGHLGLVAGISGGDGRNVLNEDNGLLYVARLEYKLDPKGQDMAEFDFRADTSKPIFSMGLAGAFNQGARRARSTIGSFTGFDDANGDRVDTQADLLHGEVDLIAKWHGWSLQAELLARRATAADDGAEPRDSVGWFASLGRAITRELWVGARFAEVRPWDSDSPVKLSHELRGTVGFFPAGHDLKIQLDAGRLYSSDIADGTTEVRLQTQLFL